MNDEPKLLAMLLGLAALLYLVSWLVAGPPGSQGAPEPAPSAVSLAARTGRP